MADKTGYIGRNPGDSSVTIARKTYTPTSDTTEFTFTAGYTVGLLDVYLNGAKLIDGSDYDANTGSTVGLTSAAQNGDVVEIIAYKAFNLANPISNTASGSLEVGTTLSVGSTATLSGVTTCEGDLYVGGDLYVLDDIVYDEVSGRNLNITGILTVGTAVTIANDSGINVTGVVTATSFSGDGSSLTGVANTEYIDAASLTVSGISTFSNTVSLPDAKSITLGNDDDLEIHHAAGGNSYIKNNTLALDIRGDTTHINSKNNAVTFLKANASGLMATTGISTIASAKVTDTTASTSTSTGALVVSGGVGIAGSLHVGENVSVGGTLTYEDVTNIDSVGVVTARLGVIVDAGRGLQVTAGGVNVDAGIGTFDAGVIVGDGARLLVGHTASDDRDGYQSTLQVSGTGGDDSSASLGRWSADTSAPGLVLSKSRNGTVGSHTVVQASDVLGTVQFQGDDGTNYHVGAQIQADVQSGVGNDDMPADLIFATNSGSTSTTERLRLTSKGGLHLANGDLIERCKISSTALNSDQVCNLDDGMVHYRTSNLGGSGGTSLILTSSVGLATAMATGDMMSFTLIHATNTTGNYVDHINIDHIVITENWVGGSAPSAGGSSGVDVYTFNIIKKASGTGDTGFTVIGNHIKTS